MSENNGLPPTGGDASAWPSCVGVGILLTLIVLIAGVGVPPSLPKAGLSPMERGLEGCVIPILGIAAALSFAAVVAGSVSGSPLARWLIYAGIVMTNVAGVLSGLYGREGIGLGGTLILTSPVIAVMLWREIARRWRADSR